MKMNLLFKHKKFSEGFNLIVSPENSPLRWLRFGVLYLKNVGSTFGEESGDKEVALCILKGQIDIEIDSDYFKSINHKGLGSRQDPFSGAATLVYVPSGSKYEIKAATSELEVAIIKTTSGSRTPPVILTPSDLMPVWVGSENWKRQVTTLIGDNIKSERLVLGETRNPPGNWSSYPPHKHDVKALPNEIPLEEVYFFKFKPSQGFGIQRIYSDDEKLNSLNEVYVVENNDAVVIPSGYHPIVSGAGYELFHIWAIAGEGKKYGAGTIDPKHLWIKNQAK